MPPSRRRKKAPPGAPKGALILLALLLVGAAAYLAWRARAPAAPSEALPGKPPAAHGAEAEGKRRRPAAGGEEKAAPPGREAGAPTHTVPLPPAGARIALVIDDLGRSLGDLDLLARLGVPITYAVLPYESMTPEVLAELRRLHREVLCHLPMEPKNGANPGPGALRLGMSAEELAETTRAALDACGGVAGANNHMGSSLSADRPSMTAILRVVGKRGLFFLDSRTSPDSVGYAVARELGIPAAERQVFLDPDPGREEVREQFARLLAQARERGAAIAIGHPHPETLEMLLSEVPKAKAEGYEFVPVSYLLDRTGELPE